MIDESTKLERAIHVIKSLTDGNDPFTGEPYEENSLMNDPRMIRCFYFVIEILEKYKAGNTIKYIDRKNLPYKFPSNLVIMILEVFSPKNSPFGNWLPSASTFRCMRKGPLALRPGLSPGLPFVAEKLNW